MNCYMSEQRFSIWKQWTLRTFVILSATFLLTLSAKIHAPFGLVKMSLQPISVVLLGFILGSRYAALAVGLYLVEGIMGFPVFQSTPERGIGLAYMMGPTGGYLIGFLIAGYVAGFIDKMKATIPSLIIVSTSCILIMLLCGVSWLVVLTGDLFQAVSLGFLPFISSSILQIGGTTVLGALLVRHSRVMQRIRSIL